MPIPMPMMMMMMMIRSGNTAVIAASLSGYSTVALYSDLDLDWIATSSLFYLTCLFFYDDVNEDASFLFLYVLYMNAGLCSKIFRNDLFEFIYRFCYARFHLIVIFNF